jgi:hypothetical protein
MDGRAISPVINPTPGHQRQGGQQDRKKQNVHQHVSGRQSAAATTTASKGSNLFVTQCVSDSGRTVHLAGPSFQP